MSSSDSVLNLVVQHTTPYLSLCLFIFRNSREKYLSYLSVSHCQVLEFMHVNEFLFKKPDKIDFTFIETALFY